MSEILIINVSGQDKPGITSAMTAVLASSGANILDIGQAVIHASLSLGVLVEVSDEAAREQLKERVTQQMSSMQMRVRF